VAGIASVQPVVTVTSASASMVRPHPVANQSAMAARSSGMPDMGAYWLCPALTAAMAASFTKSGPSKLGKPCPRLMALCFAARALMGVKIVSPKAVTRAAIC
jgi:hypothetical protein